ncbi:unnamed protein product [Arctia plantaginis]|uniref:C2H2-type domain-containing protein n=1 Tax=Arctia plantaginis TaxID=874455 RepID=A0A8S1B2Y0_ARCPL|nr:unnamed protein product [Arctia plantaginis]
MDEYFITALTKLNTHEYNELTIVLGNESCDLDSSVSSIVYAIFLNWQYNQIKCKVCTREHRPGSVKDDIFVPILNVDRSDYELKTEVAYLLRKYGIYESNLIFRDDHDMQILISRTKTKVVLVDHHVMANRDQFLIPLVTEIIDHRPLDKSKWPYKADTRSTIQTVGSCATLVAQRIKTLGALVAKDVDFFNAYPVCSKLLYATIILDTVNFSKEVNKARVLDEEIILFLESLIKPDDYTAERERTLDSLVRARSDVSKLTADQLLKKDVKVVSHVFVPCFPFLVKEFLKMPKALSAVNEALAREKCSVALLLGMDLTEGVQRDAAVYYPHKSQDTATEICKHLQEWTRPSLGLSAESLADVSNVNYFWQLNLSASPTDLRMESIVNTHLQDMYEKLTLKQFETKDSKPTLACYLCCARLQNCYQLSMNCLQSEELLTQMLSGKMLHPSNLKEVTPSMKLGTTPVIVETFEDLLYDVDGQVKVDSTQSSGVETEVKMVVNEVVEDSIPAGCIKEEPGTDDSFQDEDIEDEIPLDIVKHEFGLPSILKDKKPADQMENLKSSWMGELQTSEQGSSDAEENTRLLFKWQSEMAQLTRHMKTHIGKKTVKCNLCEKNFTSKTKLGIQILKDNKPADQIENLKSSLMGELKTVEQGSPDDEEKTRDYRSDGKVKCKQRVTTETTDSYTGKPYSCSYCGKAFVRRDHLTRHMKTHTSKELVKCNLSILPELKPLEQGSSDAEENSRDYRSNGKVKFKKCVKSKTTDTYVNKPYACRYCRKDFARRAHLVRHMYSHTGEKPLKCNLCEKSFTSKPSLANHIVQNHTHKKPFPCSKCDEGFMVQIRLNEHIVLKHVDWKSCVCEYCSEVYTSKTDLKHHVRSNHGEKPFKCDLCNNCYARHCDLLRHYPMHAGKKVYKCDVCPKSYTKRRCYLIHYRIHTGEKPYKCDICKKKFRAKSHVLKHIRNHMRSD